MRCVVARSASVRRLTAATVLLPLVTAGLTACGSSGPTRSVQAFCDTYWSERAQFTDKYSGIGQSDGTDDGTKALEDLLLGIQSLGDVEVILTKLDNVAPNDIEPDVAAV